MLAISGVADNTITGGTRSPKIALSVLTSSRPFMPGIYKSAIMPENWSISSCRLSKFAPDENVRALKPSLVIIDCKCSLDISKSSTTAKVALDGAEFVAGRSSIGFRGSKILNSVPTPTVLVTCSAPPSLSTLRLATDKPIPAPGKRWPVECSPR